MSQQASISKARYPLLRAAALKNIDIKVVNPETNMESPFDFQKTLPGCYLNIRWKPLPGTENTKLQNPFPSLKLGEPGVHQYSKIKYLDPASIAYEMHALAVSNVYGNDRKEVEFQSTKLFRGVWLYAGVVENHNDLRPVDDFSCVCMFWNMIIHFHRTGECLPPSEEFWTEDNIEFENILANFGGSMPGLVEKATKKKKPSGNNNVITMPSNVMSFVLKMNHLMGLMQSAMMSGGTPPSSPPKAGDAVYERSRNNVDFVAPTIAAMRPLWWTAHNDLWTKTLQHFIQTGKAPCMWILKEAGCQNRRTCSEDHDHFVPLVRNLSDLIKKPWSEQMKTSGGIEMLATGRGVEIENELSEAGGLPKEERQVKLKDKGNEYVKKQDYATAIKYYDEAIKIDPTVEAAAAIFSNRSLCHVNKFDFKKALADADKCVALRPNWFRGHFRRGCALEKLNKFQEALNAFEEVEKLQPGEDMEEFKKRCQSQLGNNNQNINSTSTTEKRTNTNKDDEEDEDYETVSAVLFPADANRRPYEVKIPANIVEHADQIHSLLGITQKEVDNLQSVLERHEPKFPPQFPPHLIKCPYSVREWAQDYKSKNGGKTIPYGFQPRELVRGDNDKSSLMALINPQSKGPVNLRMCAMMTEMDGQMNLTDGNPNSCKCRGDAIVIRLRRDARDGRPAKEDRKLLSWGRAEEVMNKLGHLAAGKRTPQQVASGRQPGVFVEIAAVMNEILANDRVPAVDFKYEEYDAVWGLFTHIQVPSQKNMYATSLMPNTPEAEKQLAGIMSQALGGGGGGGANGGGRRGGRR